MSINVPGVTDAEIEKLITTVIVNFEPRMIRVENTMITMFSVITIFILLILVFTLFVATHVILERRAKRSSAKQTYKLYKKTSASDDDSSSSDDEEEVLYLNEKRRQRKRLNRINR